jgi:hypothetical protein
VLKRWVPVVVMMAAIFAASSQPKESVPHFGLVDVWVKKAGHIVLYGLLAAAWLRGLAWGRPPGRRHFAWAVALAVVYGVTDEYHQSFVPGRGATAADVVIDAAGALLGAGLWVAWRGRAQRRGRPFLGTARAADGGEA